MLLNFKFNSSTNGAFVMCSFLSSKVMPFLINVDLNDLIKCGVSAKTKTLWSFLFGMLKKGCSIETPISLRLLKYLFTPRDLGKGKDRMINISPIVLFKSRY